MIKLCSPLNFLLVNESYKEIPPADACCTSSIPAAEGKPLLLHHVLISVMGDGASSTAIALQRPWESV